MPGPCSSKPYTKRPANPNRKAEARLARRQDDFDLIKDDNIKHGMCRPGSQNRNKK